MDTTFNTMTAAIASLESQIESLNLKFTEQIKSNQKEATDSINKLEKELIKLRVDWNTYVPKRGDKIDEKLSNFINKYPEQEKMRILFLRESEGVYRFGQRRVQIKIEKGDQILVRVGGGYLSVSDFIERFTQNEADQIERRNVVSRFENKKTLQHIASTNAITATQSVELNLTQNPKRNASVKKLGLKHKRNKSVFTKMSKKET